MEKLIENIYSQTALWIHNEMLTLNTVAQLACILIGFAVAFLASRKVRPLVVQWIEKAVSNELLRSLLIMPRGIGCSLVFLLLIQLCTGVFVSMDDFPHWLFAAGDLAVAWIVIRLLTLTISNKALARGTAVIVWGITFLHIVGLLKHISAFLRGLTLSIGEAQFSVYAIVKGVLLAALCLQIAVVISRFSSKHIHASSDLSPSLQVLLTKIINVVLYAAAILFALTSVGIDLTNLAIFTGALGVGIGFGLKSIISNYVAGVILLMDHSIKPGDTIELGDVYGTVRNMYGRYASILTRDGKELLIPNEQLISNEVVNWTYSHKQVRLIVSVGISYDSDLHKAMELLATVSGGIERVLQSPAPRARLRGYGDSSVDLELCIWISDAESGVNNIKSDVLVAIWDAFHENDIRFPFPQRDLHIKPESVIQFEVKDDKAKLP